MASPFTFFIDESLDAVVAAVNAFILAAIQDSQYYAPWRVGVEYRGGNPVYVVSLRHAGFDDMPFGSSQTPFLILEANSPEDLTALVTAATEAGNMNPLDPFTVNRHGATYFAIALSYDINITSYFSRIFDSRSSDDLTAQMEVLSNLPGYNTEFGSIGTPFLAGGASYLVSHIGYSIAPAPLATGFLWTANSIGPAANGLLSAYVTFDQPLIVNDGGDLTIVAQSSNTEKMPDITLFYDNVLSQAGAGFIAFTINANTANGEGEHYTLNSNSAITNFSRITENGVSAANTLPLGLVPQDINIAAPFIVTADMSGSGTPDVSSSMHASIQLSSRVSKLPGNPTVTVQSSNTSKLPDQVLAYDGGSSDLSTGFLRFFASNVDTSLADGVTLTLNSASILTHFEVFADDNFVPVSNTMPAGLPNSTITYSS